MLIRRPLRKWDSVLRLLHVTLYQVTRAPSQYPKKRLFVRSRKVSKQRDLCLELSDRSEIWQALRQHCCRCACQILKRYDNLKYQSRGLETSRDLTKRRLFGYWDGALDAWSDLFLMFGAVHPSRDMTQNQTRIHSGMRTTHFLKYQRRANRYIIHNKVSTTFLRNHW